jgi:hypothetical protein
MYILLYVMKLTRSMTMKSVMTPWPHGQKQWDGALNKNKDNATIQVTRETTIEKTIIENGPMENRAEVHEDSSQEQKCCS